MLRVKGFDDTRGVGDAVEKIGIAESEVLGTGFDLLANVRKNDFPRHDAKLARINRYDRTMAAEMFAAARSFSVTGDAMRAVRENDVSVAAKGGKIRSVGKFECETRKFCAADCDLFVNVTRS